MTYAISTIYQGKSYTLEMTHPSIGKGVPSVNLDQQVKELALGILKTLSANNIQLDKQINLEIGYNAPNKMEIVDESPLASRTIVKLPEFCIVPKDFFAKHYQSNSFLNFRLIPKNFSEKGNYMNLTDLIILLNEVLKGNNKIIKKIFD